jgi:hypothetical protein
LGNDEVSSRRKWKNQTIAQRSFFESSHQEGKFKMDRATNYFKNSFDAFFARPPEVCFRIPPDIVSMHCIIHGNLLFLLQYNAAVPLSVFYHATQKLKLIVKQLEDSANEREQLAAVEVLHKVQAGTICIVKPQT